MFDVTSSFNEIKVDGNNNKIYIGSKEKFEPMMEWVSKKIEIEINAIGKRYNKKININIIHLHKLFRALSFEFLDKKIIKKFKSNIEIMNYLQFFDKEFYEYILTNDLIFENYLFFINKLLNFQKQLELEKDNLGFYLSGEIRPYEFMSSKKDIEKSFKTLKYIIPILSSYVKKLQQEYYFINIYHKKTMTISGEALIGKTHLFCDVALNRIKGDQPTLLFFGNQFKSQKTIIENMVSILGLQPISEDEFLEALNIWGEEYKTRTLIMIDAINETENPKIWQEGIIKFCEQIKSYSNLALAISTRDVEKNKIITPENEEYIKNEIVEVEHKGFEGIELEAVRAFCESLGVEFPKVPLHTYRLFVNPGMLFLYIETIKNSSKKVDTSIINPLTVFKSYIEDLERKYYQKYMNEVDEDDEVVSEAIKEFISLGIKKNYLHFYLDYKKVKKKLKPLHNKILEFLISEGVLNKLKQENGTKVYFTYQKFENFFIANYLLNDFESNKEKIYKIIREHHGAISEALFMQIPEVLGKEVFDLNIWLIRDMYINKQYLQSLVWRRPSTITDATFKYINFISEYRDLNSIFLDVILQLSNISNHPLNITRLHKKLLKFTISQRDYYWSIYIHNSFRSDDIVKRLINWAWNKKQKFEIEDESLYLYGLTLSWFLTSSNRKLRDGATKALVNIFTNNVNVFLKVLKEFETVDDLYILERLYAVGYGIVLRSENQNGFKELGEYVYQTIFNQDEVVEHILLRDYAKLAIEKIDSVIELDIKQDKILPPYGSKMPSSYPTYNEIEQHSREKLAFSRIVDSMRTESIMPYGDFGRYVFQASLSSFNFEECDIQDLSNYAVKLIYNEYISDMELFSKAENNMNGISYERNMHRVERIGKKYQWLAMYKVLAKVADNYKIRDNWNYDEFINYMDTSQLYIRDIDPSTILKEKKQTEKKCWFDISNNEFENIELQDNEKWLQSKDKLPSIKEIINPISKSEYLILNYFFRKDGSKNKEEYRTLMYDINSYIVKKEDFDDILMWVKEHNFYQQTIDNEQNFIDDYLRQYPDGKNYDYWIDSYKFNIYHGSFKGKIPHKILKTTLKYLNEGKSYDASISGYIDIALPSNWIVKQMNLKQSLIDGQWLNINGKVVFFDPTVNICSSDNEGILIADRKLLLNWLNENGYVIFWILRGEKDLRNSDSSRYEEKPFIGYGGISGYAYFKGEELIENMDIQLVRRL